MRDLGFLIVGLTLVCGLAINWLERREIPQSRIAGIAALAPLALVGLVGALSVAGILGMRLPWQKSEMDVTPRTSIGVLVCDAGNQVLIAPSIEVGNWLRAGGKRTMDERALFEAYARGGSQGSRIAMNNDLRAVIETIESEDSGRSQLYVAKFADLDGDSPSVTVERVGAPTGHPNTGNRLEASPPVLPSGAENSTSQWVEETLCELFAAGRSPDTTRAGQLQQVMGVLRAGYQTDGAPDSFDRAILLYLRGGEGELAQADSLVQGYLRSFPDHASARCLMADILVRRVLNQWNESIEDDTDDLDMAERYAKDAMRIAPELAAAHKSHGMVLQARVELARLYPKAVLIDSDKCLREALAQYEEAAACAPGNRTQILSNCIPLRSELGDISGAYRTFKEIQETEGDYVPALINMAEALKMWSLESTGRPSDAGRVLLLHVLRIGEDRWGIVHYNLAIYYALIGKTKEFEEELRAAQRIGDSNYSRLIWQDPDFNRALLRKPELEHVARSVFADGGA